MEKDFDNSVNSDQIEVKMGDDQQFIDDQLELNYLGNHLSVKLAEDFKANVLKKKTIKNLKNVDITISGQSRRIDLTGAASRKMGSSNELMTRRDELKMHDNSRDNQLEHEMDISMNSNFNEFTYDQRKIDDLSKDDDLKQPNYLEKQPESNLKSSGNRRPEKTVTVKQNGSNSVVNNLIKASVSNNDNIKDEKQSKKESSKSIIIVHLLNGGKFECPVTSKSTGRDVFSQTCDYLILREHEYFGLTYRDAENFRIWVNPEKKICKQIKDNPNSLHFEVKFFPEPTDLKENITRFFLCLQIRNNMVEEKISCSDETYAILGSYLVQSELGNYDPNKHGEDYLKEFKFAPKPTPSLIQRLAELHKERRGLTAPEAELLFLQNAKKLSIYGLDFYPAKDANEIDFTIGVCSSGLSVYKGSVCVETLPWNKIIKVCYNCENFSIKVKPVDDKDGAENTVSFKLCSPKAAYGLWRITVAHHTFFKSLSADLQSNSKKVSKKSSKLPKHHRSKEKKLSSKHHHKKAKSQKEDSSSKAKPYDKKIIKSGQSDETDSKRMKKRSRHRLKEIISRDVRVSRKEIKENNRNSENGKEQHSSSRHKRWREEMKSSNYRDDRSSYREERVRKERIREERVREERIREERVREERVREEKASYRDERTSYWEDNYQDKSRDRKRIKTDEIKKECDQREEREKNYRKRRESHKERSSSREKRNYYPDEDQRDYREAERREEMKRDYRKEERQNYRDEDKNYSRSQRDKSPKSKRHKHKHSKSESTSKTIKKIHHPMSIAESHYQSLAKESMNYLNEKIKLKDENKQKNKPRIAEEKKSSADEQLFDDENNAKKALNQFVEDQLDSNDEKDSSSVNCFSKNTTNEKISSVNKEMTSSSQSKPGSPPKKDVKLSSKSNIKFDIFWDGAENESVHSSDDSKGASNKQPNKPKDDSMVLNDGEKRFIPRVLLNGNDAASSLTINTGGSRVFTKFEIKCPTRTGPKTPPDDFNMFGNSTVSNQSIPTPTQDESQPGLNEKFNDKFDNSSAGSSNANSVRSLSPRSMQSDTQLVNSDNILTSPTNKNSINQSSSLNFSSLNQISNSSHHLATKINNIKSSKYEIYDPEAPLESPEQQPPSNNSIYNNASNSYTLKNSDFNFFNSSSVKAANGNNEPEIDSPFSPSKPIDSPIIQPQPKAPPSCSSNPQQLPQFTGSELKLVLDHLIKAAQLQQKKGEEHSNSSPFKKQQQQSSKLINSNFNTIDDDLPSSAVELNSREKYIKKLNRQERVVDEMKCSLKPYYQRKEINKEEYKSIMRKAVPKICHSKTGEINPIKIKNLVENYVNKLKRERSKDKGLM